MSAAVAVLRSWVTRTTGQDRGRRAVRAAAASHGLFAVAPVVGTIYLLHVFRAHWFAVDFRLAYWPAAHRVLHGLSPYINPHGLSIARDLPFPYPAVGAVVLAPFGLLSPDTGGAIFTALNIASLPLALRLLGVRDWRVYGIVFLWLPVISGWSTANVTLIMVLGIAAVWRWRDRPFVAGLLTALMISIKPVIWPLGLWLLLTRRYVSVAYGLAIGLVLNVVAWGVLGFDQIHRYRALISAFGRSGERLAYTLVALASHAGAHGVAAYAIGLAPGAALGLAWLLRSRRIDDRTAMVLCIAVTLFLTSIVWLQYFAFLIVPLALMRPRLSPVWGLPLLMDVCVPVNNPAVWQQVLAVGAAATVIFIILRAPEPVRLRLPSLRVRRVSPL